MKTAFHPRFTGTGENGKPRVAVACATYKERNYTFLKDSPEVEFVGFATDGTKFNQLLTTQKPDVVLIGAQFDDNWDLPIEVLFNKFGSKKNDSLPLPGVVLCTVLEETAGAIKTVAEGMGIVQGRKDTTETPLFEYISGFTSILTRNTDLLNALKKVDPFKSNINQGEQ